MSEKVDLINGAYSLLRISGLTVLPSTSDLDLALTRLENMAAMFAGKTIDSGYFFEDEPDPNTPHNMERKYWYPYEALLAQLISPDFGKSSDMIMRAAKSAYSTLASFTSVSKQVQPPARMPVGSGNRWKKFYVLTAEVPQITVVITMNVDNVNDFTEHYDAYLRADEDISSYTIEADAGLTINSDSLDSPDVLYQIQTDKVGVFQLKLIVTTSDSRILTRIITFQVSSTDVIE